MSNPYHQYVNQASERFGVDRDLINSVIRAESNWDPRAGSHAGAQGLMQLMPGTFAGLGVGNNVWDPRQNIFAGTKYLSQQLKAFGGDTRLALAAYNAGPGAARKAITAYPETRNYVQKVMGWYGGGSGSHSHGQQGGGGAAPLGQWRVAGGGRSGGSDAVHGPTSAEEARIRFAFVDEPTIANGLIAQQWAKATPGNPTGMVGVPGINRTGGSNPYGMPSGPGGGFRHWNLKDVQDYQRRLGQIGNMFGLKQDPGDGQRMGGNHDPESLHYAGRAWDWGNGQNSHNQLSQLAQWALQHKNRIAEFYYTPMGWSIVNGQWKQGYTIPGHSNHAHLGLI